MGSFVFFLLILLSSYHKDWKSLKKVELHRHLEGSIRLSTLKELYAAQVAPNPTDQQVIDWFCITTPVESLSVCMKKFEHLQAAIASPEIIERISFEVCEDLWNEGIVVGEIRYSPQYIKLGHDELSLEEIHAAVLRGMEKAKKKYPIKIGLIGIIDRMLPQQKCQEAVEFFITHKEFIGIDLANDESKFNVMLFTKQFKQAKDAGLRITVTHVAVSIALSTVCVAGEVPVADAPQWVRNAVDHLFAERIGHGIHVLLDEETVKYCKQKGIVFEVCPSSNYLTQSVTSLEEHPIKKMIDAGLKVTINTDDPGLFCVDLLNEIQVAMNQCGLSQQQVLDCFAVAEKATFIP